MASSRTILIVGAGIAGLAAAQALQSQDFTVTVLEARNRIGGRIWTRRDLANIPLDMGAEWIVGTEDNPILDLARTLHLDVFQTDWRSLALYRSSGGRTRQTDQRLMEDQLNAVLSLVRTRRAHDRAADKPDRSLREAVDEVLAEMRLEPSRQAELDYVITTDIEHEFAADLSDLSMYHWDEEGRLGGDELLLPGGFDAIAASLAAHLDIRTNHAVKRITTTAHGVTLTTNQGEFSADRCLVTAPLGVLQHGGIEFVPELPAAKRAAIHSLHVGLLNKTFLQFPQVFWPEEHVLGRIAEQQAEQQGEWPWFVNLFPATGQSMLIGLNAGAFARQLEALSDNEVVAAMMRALRQMFGHDIPQPSAWRVTRWATDPYARGSYSHIPPGASADAYDTLAQPINDQVFFAGEATTRQYAGTVHGAYASGLREAARIAQMAYDSNRA